MIKCTRCGTMNSAGAVNCQSCGAPLSNNLENNGMVRANMTDQSGLPAWLGSLRAGERSVSPAQASTNFYTADFIEDDALPSWMRAERDETHGNTGAIPPVLRSASLPSPTTGGSIPPQGIEAQSLIDNTALPSWMQGNTPVPDVPPASGFAASSLVQSDSVPDWMKSLQSSQNVAPPSMVTPPVQAQPAQNSTTPRAGGSGTGFSARDLIDQQALPSWMKGQAQGPEASASQTGQAGFSARDLIDQQALPSWMAQQGQSNTSGMLQGQGQPPQQPASAHPFGQPPQTTQPAQPGAQGFSASSLLDTDSLPPWLREGGNREQRGPIQGQNNVQQASPSAIPPAWGNSSWSDQGAAMQSASPQGSSFPASSLIDNGAVPDWLRTAQQPQPGAAGQSGTYGNEQRPGAHAAYAGPPRVENVRVPSRPRGEAQPNDNSEVAANVFASMLGVSSTAPSYPGTPMPGPMNTPYAQPGMNPQPQVQPMQSAQPGMGNPMGLSGMQGNPGMGAANTQSYGPSANMMPGAGNYGTYIGAGQNSPVNTPSMPASPYQASAPVTSQASEAQQEQKSTKKRGLFGAILDWLSR